VRWQNLIKSKSLWAVTGAGSAWLVLPPLLRFLANRALRKLPGYSASIGGLSLNPVTATVSLRDVQVHYVSDGHRHSLAKIEKVTGHARWSDLLRGKLVCFVDIVQPEVNADIQALKNNRPPESDKAQANPETTNGKNDVPWQAKVRALPPIRLEHVKIVDGQFRIRNAPGQDGAPLEFDEFDFAVRNLTNSSRVSSSMKATVQARARALGSGIVFVQAEGYPLAEAPTFNADLEIKKINLMALRPVIRNKLGSDIRRGEMDLAIEAAAAEGKLTGYATPVLDHVKFEKTKNRKESGIVKGAFVRGLTKLLKNKEEDRVATRIEFSGPIDDPKVGVAAAIKSVLKNAFGSPLVPAIEGSVGLVGAGRTAADVRLAGATVKKTRLAMAFGMIKETFSRWSAHEVPRLASSLSYYTAFSLAPLLILAIAIAGFVFGREAAQGQIMQQIGGLVGSQSAQAIQSMVQAASKPSSGILATVIGLVSLLSGASGVFNELNDGLRRIWGTGGSSGVKELVKKKAKAFGLVLGIGFLLLVSLLISAGVAAMSALMKSSFSIPPFVIELINFLVSFGVITVLFAVLFKTLPETRVAWKDVWIGGAVTSLLFTLGKSALGLYLGRGSVASAYGAAGSILVILLWVYYSGLIFYFGAEFTHLYAEQFGSRRA
jgi:membrane protein